MKRIFLGMAMLVAAALAGSAQAQVAITELVPVQPFHLGAFGFGLNNPPLTAQNPAAIHWGSPSRAGAGLLQGTFDGVDAALPESGDTVQAFGGVRLVFPNLALAAGGFTGSESNSRRPNQVGLNRYGDPVVEEPRFTVSYNKLQLSVGIPGFLSIGVGQESGSVTQPDTATPSADVDFSTRTRTLGAALNLGGLIYLGAARGTQKLDVEAFGVIQPQQRDFTKTGVALRFGEEWQWHLEAHRMEFDPFEDQFGTASPVTATDYSGIVVQTIFRGFLVGVTQGDIEVQRVPGNPEKQIIEVSILDVGWVPTKGGFSVTGRAILVEPTGTELGTNPIFSRRMDTTSLSVAWLF